LHHCQTHPRITQQYATKIAENKPIVYDRKLRQPQAAKNQIFLKKLFFPQISIGLFRDSGLWYCRGVWKGILFTAAKIKATHGKGADFYRQHLANNDYYSEHDRVEGHWRGSLASVFGLENESVAQDVFSIRIPSVFMIFNARHRNPFR